MKVETDRTAFASALGAILPAAGRDGASYRAVMRGCRIDAEPGLLRLTCSDLDRTATVTMAAEVAEPGSALPPAALLASLVGRASSERITMVLDDTTLALTMGDAEAVLATFNLADWPRLGTESGQTVKATATDVDRIIRAAYAAEAKDFSTGLRCIRFADATATTADHHRSATATLSVEVPAMLAPAAESITALKSLGGGEAIIGAAGNFATFATLDGTLSWAVRCVEAAYPDTDQFYKGDRPHRLTVERGALLAAVAMVHPFAVAASAALPLRFDLDDDRLTVSGRAAELGSGQAAIAASGSLPGVVAFGASYLTDTLKAVGDDEITLEMSATRKPAIVVGDGLTQLLMPIDPKIVGA